MTLAQFKKLKEAFEANGQICTGVYLTGEQAQELRHELYLFYGQDPGPMLTTLYGVEVLSISADTFALE